MNRFRSRRLRLGAGIAASVALVLGLMVFAGLGASGTLTAESAQYAPKNQTPPAITGTPQDNATLVASTGQWEGDVTDFSYQWQVCDSNGNSCSNISGATKNSYGVTSQEVGKRIRVAVTAKNKDGSTTATSAPTGTVVAAASGGGGGGGGGSSNGCSSKGGTVNAKDVGLPVRLLIDKWSFNPAVINRSTPGFTARIHIADTCNRSVVGAQVWATAIPYNQVSVVQGTTGGDGYANLNFTVQQGFPANPGRQQIMAMLVRATIPSGSVLAGVSTRRVLNLSVNVK